MYKKKKKNIGNCFGKILKSVDCLGEKRLYCVHVYAGIVRSEKKYNLGKTGSVRPQPRGY